MSQTIVNLFERRPIVFLVLNDFHFFHLVLFIHITPRLTGSPFLGRSGGAVCYAGLYVISTASVGIHNLSEQKKETKTIAFA